MGRGFPRWYTTLNSSSTAQVVRTGHHLDDNAIREHHHRLDGTSAARRGPVGRRAAAAAHADRLGATGEGGASAEGGGQRRVAHRASGRRGGAPRAEGTREGERNFTGGPMRSWIPCGNRANRTRRLGKGIGVAPGKCSVPGSRSHGIERAPSSDRPPARNDHLARSARAGSSHRKYKSTVVAN